MNKHNAKPFVCPMCKTELHWHPKHGKELAQTAGRVLLRYFWHMLFYITSGYILAYALMR